KEKVWCLYPNKNAPTQSVYDAFGQDSSTSPQGILNMHNYGILVDYVNYALESALSVAILLILGPLGQQPVYISSCILGFDPINITIAVNPFMSVGNILVTKKMEIKSSKLNQDKANEVWGEDLRCISLATGASAMHKLRPQPSWDRTCTAAAAVGLLDELHSLQELSSLGFDKQAEALEDALGALLDALTARRLRMGRSITRRERHNRDIC
ncbi:hypothetical protein C3L33_10456, partial [Rhododendron williamsianum]